MRIAFIAPHFGEAFGQERAVSDSITLLKEAGHSVQTYEELPAAYLHSLSPPWEVKQTTEKILKSLYEFSPDLVHFVDQYDFRIMGAVSQAFPSVLTAHTVAPTCPASHRLIYRQEICPKKSGLACMVHHRRFGCLRHFKNDLHRLNAIQNYLFKRRALKQFRAVIAISNYIEDTLIEDGFDPKRVFRIYNSVTVKDGSAFSGAPKKLIVTACRLVELKGIEFTLRALKEIEKEEWTFWILGEGPEKARLESLTEELGLEKRVEFKGRLDRETTEQVIRSSFFVAQTNVGPEGFGLTVAEAQALGKPVVAFNVPALNEIVVDGETGILVPPRDIEKLAKAFKDLLKDPALRLYYGSQGREQMGHVFSPKNHLKKTLEVYEAVTRKVAKRESISLR